MFYLEDIYCFKVFKMSNLFGVNLIEPLKVIFLKLPFGFILPLHKQVFWKVSRDWGKGGGSFLKPLSTLCVLLCVKVNINFGHLNSFVDPTNKRDVADGKKYIMKMFYGTLDVEESVEALTYDLSAFLASAGGNLGLALGFSCLAILLDSITFLYNFFSKYLDK